MVDSYWDRAQCLMTTRSFTPLIRFVSYSWGGFQKFGLLTDHWVKHSLSPDSKLLKPHLKRKWLNYLWMNLALSVLARTVDKVSALDPIFFHLKFQHSRDYIATVIYVSLIYRLNMILIYRSLFGSLLRQILEKKKKKILIGLQFTVTVRRLTRGKRVCWESVKLLEASNCTGQTDTQERVMAVPKDTGCQSEMV